MPHAHPFTRSALVLLLLLFAAVHAGCRADTTGLSTLTVEELSKLRDSGADLVVCDANNTKTRGEEGVIPGAVLLTSYRDFDATLELPADPSKQVVFYCHSAMCGAAADAARKAVALGWHNVWVMPDGIRGWTEAGLPVVRPVTG